MKNGLNKKILRNGGNRPDRSSASVTEEDQTSRCLPDEIQIALSVLIFVASLIFPQGKSAKALYRNFQLYNPDL